MKVAIIGSGPAAFGSLLRLLEMKKAGKELEITVFATGSADQESQIEAAYQDHYQSVEINNILKKVKTQSGGGLMPARSFHHQAVLNHQGHADLKTEIKMSNSFGGIGNYWSSSVFPNHLHHDPLVEKLGDLSAHYDFIAQSIPVAGRKGDPLSTYFNDDSINQPAISLDPAMENLLGCCDGLHMGVNRFAIQTEQTGPNSCIECGDCMYGCPRDAIFRAAHPIWEKAQAGLCQIIYEKVIEFTSEEKGVTLRTQTRNENFDQVFICAGAFGSAELVRNSLGTPERALELYDTMLWYFPAVSFWPQKTGRADKGVAFAELAGGLYDEARKTYNHLLVSRFPNAIVDNIIGRSRWSQMLAGLAGRFALIGAMYGCEDEYITYGLDQVDGGFKAISKKKSQEQIDPVKFKAFQSYLAAKGWHTHQKLVMENATSSHYASNLGLAYGIKDLPRHGQTAPHVYVCDSAGWDGPSMSQQHSFTIMANASRLVTQAF